MVYGEGFAAADDVVGHELTHGVTDFSAGLFYYFQSGAINESMSDVFGEFIDQTNAAGNDTAPGSSGSIGEDIPGSGAGPRHGEPARVRRPSGPDGQPALLRRPDLIFDNGGVHFNSGVNNKAAFLMTDGGSFNGRTVTGMGIPKAAQIYYDVQTQFLTSGSDYGDLASALPQACDDLVGAVIGGSAVTAANCTEVRDAVAATEMTLDPPNAPAPHAPAATCPSGQVRTDLFLDDMEPPAGSFTVPAPWQFLEQNEYAHSGIGSLYAPALATVSDTAATMTQGVTIPANATSAFMRFDHAYDFEFDSNFAYDGGVLEISRNGAPFADVGALLTDVGYSGTLRGLPSNNPIAGRAAFVRRSNGFRASRATLTSLKGENVRFRFRVGTDGAVGGTGWIIDDVHIYSCAAPPPAAGQRRRRRAGRERCLPGGARDAAERLRAEWRRC